MEMEETSIEEKPLTEESVDEDLASSYINELSVSG